MRYDPEYALVRIIDQIGVEVQGMEYEVFRSLHWEAVRC